MALIQIKITVALNFNLDKEVPQKNKNNAHLNIFIKLRKH